MHPRRSLPGSAVEKSSSSAEASALAVTLERGTLAQSLEEWKGSEGGKTRTDVRSNVNVLTGEEFGTTAGQKKLDEKKKKKKEVEIASVMTQGGLLKQGCSVCPLIPTSSNEPLYLRVSGTQVLPGTGNVLDQVLLGFISEASLR